MKQTKSMIGAILIIASMIISTTAVSAQLGLYTTYLNPDTPDIRISMINQDPSPAEPGGYVEVKYKVENYGLKGAKNLTVEMIPEYPFTLEPGTDSQVEIGGIQGLQLDTDGIIIKWKLRVDKNAVEGDNQVKLKYKLQYRNAPEEWIEVSPFTIEVRPTESVVAISQVETNPKTMLAGKEAQVTIRIKNLASTNLKDISIKMDLSAATTPFAPLDSATEQRQKFLAPGEEASFTYNLIVSGDATSQVYKVPVTLTYYDRLDTQHTKADIIGFVVGSEPDILVTLDTTNINKASQAGEISIKFINKGIGKVKFLTATITPQNGYKLTSPNEVYVGNIDSDDYETADYKVYVEPGTTGQIALPIKLGYRDANNNQYSKDAKITVPIYSEEELVKYGITQKAQSPWGIVIILLIIVVAIIGYGIYKRRKAHK